MAVKLSVLRTKTVSAVTPDALDAAILAFTQTLGEEKYVALRFQVAATSTGALYVVLIEYTS